MDVPWVTVTDIKQLFDEHPVAMEALRKVRNKKNNDDYDLSAIV